MCGGVGRAECGICADRGGEMRRDGAIAGRGGCGGTLAGGWGCLEHRKPTVQRRQMGALWAGSGGRGKEDRTR